jgi:hypothetical protein
MNRKTFNSSTLAGTVLATALALSPHPALAAAPDTEASASQQRIPGKPQAPVDIRYRFGSSPAVGEPTQVTVYVTPLTDNEALSADYRAKGNIGLRRGGSEWGIDELGRDSLVYILQVTPNSEGRAAVQVMATIQIAGTLQNRAVTIPVQTGEAGAKPVARYSGKVATTAAGQAVVSLPAETAITAAVEQK